MIISTKVGFGQKVSGEIVVVGRSGEVLDTHDLNMELAGKILVLPIWVSREFLQKADFVGVLGVVVPSIHYRDFLYFKEHADFALLVLLEFGKLDAYPEEAKKLLGLNGKHGVLDGGVKTLEIGH